MEEARGHVAALVNARPAEVIYTSGGTEAANLALHTAKTALGVERLIVSSIEHDCLRMAAAASGLPVDLLPVKKDGIADLDALPSLLAKPGKALVVLMLANNETGVIQPVAEAAALARTAGALFLADAVQAVGRMAVDFTALAADMMFISAHKIGGPQGAGALVIREALPVEPLFRGGGQEKRRRAGTENVAGIAGFGVAARQALEESDQSVHIAALRDRLEHAVCAVSADVVVFGNGAERLPNTSLFAAPGLDAETLVMALDLDGLAVSAGSACSSGKVARSHVLSAMGVGDALSGAAIRVSLGAENTEAEIDRLVASWSRMLERAQVKAHLAKAKAGVPVFAEVER
jgi:cysteine desulfurase